MLGALATVDTHEVIVVDGGSTDGTQEYLRQQKHARVIETQPGRGNQMNAGARMATGDVLLFLHSDCVLPGTAPAQLREALTDQKTVAGCFLVRFAERSHALRLVAWGINRRTLWTRTATGDQALFMRRSAYDLTGGFPSWPLFEDVEMVSRIKRQGRFVVLAKPVTISARRWTTLGVWRTTLMMYALRLGYHAGISPFKLKQWFADIRIQAH